MSTISKRVIFAIATVGICVSLAAARAADEPGIVIGTSVAASGNLARTAREQLQGLQLWVEDVNARGGLLGRKVRMLYHDDAGDAETAAKVYEKLIVEEGAELLVGPYSADATLAAAVVTEKHEVPLLAPGATSAAFWGRGYKNVFGLLTPAAEYLDPVLEFAKHKGLRRVALVYQETGLPRELADGVKNHLIALGMRTVFEAGYDAAQTDFASIVGKLKPRRPDVLVVGSYLPDALAFMRQAKQQKLSAKIIVFSGGASLPEFGKTLGADAEGVIGVTQWEPTLSVAAVAEFARRYKVRYGYEPGVYAAAGYGAGEVLEAAVKKAGTPERARLRKALRELDTTSVLGRYRVDASGRQIGKTAYAVQWIEGERALVMPEKAATAKIVYPLRDWSKR